MAQLAHSAGRTGQQTADQAGPLSRVGVPAVLAALMPPAATPDQGRPLPRPAADRPPDIDPLALPPDPRLMAGIGADACLRAGLMPWRRVGGTIVVLRARPAPDPGWRNMLRDRHRADLLDLIEAAFGPVRMTDCTEPVLRAVLLRDRGASLVHHAETRVPAAQSCRDWNPRRSRNLALGFATVAVGIGATAPGLLLAALLGWVVLTLVLTSGLKAAAALATLRSDRVAPVPAGPVPAHLPVISLLVPLYREREIAAHLLSRLAEIDYPRDRLDLCLILEDDDRLTRAALDAAVIPDWAQVVAVPAGTLRTKPRALNFALDFARGTIVGIYDAEDAPAPDQLRRVAQRFAERGPDVACLQGVLDYYNSRSNWLARCFTLEYAAWFRVVLPGLARLGLVIPLGGTTLFLRRHAIEEVGGWDAHNVTEDADLGLRLARHGYRTELIDTVTEEEANARAWPWVRQRSRWLKGYAMTWGVHMSDPRALWRDLGPWRFFGVQLLFLGTLSQFVLAPLLWSFWLIVFGLPHPLNAVLPGPALTGLAVLFLTVEVLNVAVAWLGARRAGKARLAIWAPTLQLYFPLATLAAYKGLWEIVARPFFWDKTAHGQFVGSPVAGTATRDRPIAPLRPLPHPA